MTRGRGLAAGALVLAAALVVYYLQQNGGGAMSDKSNDARREQEVAQRVEAAYRAARQGDYGPLAELTAAGAAVVPHIAPYLADRDAAIRRETIVLLGVADGEAALPLLLRALADPVEENRDRAARAVYERYDPARVAAQAGAGQALRAGAAAGSPSAATLLLLGYFPGPETEAVLRAERDRAPAVRTKLFQWSEPVPTALPAAVALSRLGDRPARAALLRAVEGASLGELQFLLAALREIDAPEVLHALKRKTLDDQRETFSDTPVGAEPGRRLCDDAVDAFVRRLSLATGFALRQAGRYGEAEIAEVRRQIDAALPQ